MQFNSEENDIDLREIWAVVRREWLKPFVAAFLLSAIAAGISLLIPNKFTAETVLAPAADDDTSMSAISSKLGGLASLAGINPRMAVVDKTNLALEHLKSRAFISNFVRTHKYEVILIAGKKWDAKKNEWTIDPEIYDAETGKWQRKASKFKTSAPTDWELYRRFSQLMDVEFETKTGIVRLKITSKSPYTAREWASNLVSSLNDYIRQKDINQSKRNVEYLETQIQKTPLADMQRIFYQLIDQQTKKIMLAETKADYVFETIDPPLAPEKKSSPNRALIVVGSAAIGFFLTIFVVLFTNRHQLQTPRNPPEEIRRS